MKKEEIVFVEEELRENREINLLKEVVEELVQLMKYDIWNYNKEDRNTIVHLKELKN